MKKTILITGSTDGIGFETAKALFKQGHHVLLHGRNSFKLEKARDALLECESEGEVDIYLADFSKLNDVEKLSATIIKEHESIDVLINNAGILKTPEPICDNGLDVRFVVNTLAPYLLTHRLLSRFNATSRVVNLSSAAQATIDFDALNGRKQLEDMDAYSQSKLAITMWSRCMANLHKDNGPIFISVNPGSLLATKMVKEGFGMDGHNIQIGSDILIRAALSEEFATASGQYFDNDAKRFADPHPDALNDSKSYDVMNALQQIFKDQKIEL